MPFVAWAGAQFRLQRPPYFGFFLGIAGTTFAVGIPFVSAWFDPAGAASRPACSARAWAALLLSAFFTPRFVTWFGYTQTYVVVAVAVALVGVVSWTM